MHLLLEGSDLGDLLAEVRTQHGPAARVVRAERIRSGGVAGFFSKERYEVTVEMDGAGGDEQTHVSHADDQAPAAGPAPEGLQVEEREALDFEADWCLPCREMDRTTFRDPAVVRAAEPFVPFKVDVTLGDEAANAVMERFGVSGVPTYVALRGDGSEAARLVGYVPAEQMRQALESAG